MDDEKRFYSDKHKDQWTYHWHDEQVSALARALPIVDKPAEPQPEDKPAQP